MASMTRTPPESQGPDGLTYEAALAALAWQIELGADEAIGEAPIDRFQLAPLPPKAAPAVVKAPSAEPAAGPMTAPVDDPVAEARTRAEAAKNLPELAAAMESFELCTLKPAAQNFVFADGNPGARVMVIGEAPGREEDQQGKPFVGRAGKLLDRMFAAIDLARGTQDPAKALYITNVLPWRPPANRTPQPAEIALHLPFLERHIALADPDVLVLMGNTPCQALMGRAGITRIRGQWARVLGKPALPMFHPAYLLRNPAAKREAWADLLDLAAKLEET